MSDEKITIDDFIKVDFNLLKQQIENSEEEITDFYNSNETINQNISSGEVEIRKLANTLWRGKWLILLCIIFFILH